MHLIKDSLAALFVASTLAGCADEPAPPEPVPTNPVLPEPDATASNCGESGLLHARLSGALAAELDWSGSELACESMLRPDDRGMRLRFSGEIGGERLAVIIAMPTLEAGATGPEYDSVVTITVEGTGRFFSTPKLGTCWAEVTTNSPADDGSTAYNVAGELSCVSPLGEFNGNAFVDVQSLSFSGVADWSES